MATMRTNQRWTLDFGAIMAKTSPTQRTLKHLRDRGYVAGVTEKWNPHAKIRQDLFGFIDVIYLGTEIAAVQTTSGANHAARRTKILATPSARWWIECGGRIEIWSWSKRKLKHGGKAVRWTLRIETLTLNDFAAADAAKEGV
jgi:hypothetical protein